MKFTAGVVPRNEVFTLRESLESIFPYVDEIPIEKALKP